MIKTIGLSTALCLSLLAAGPALAQQPGSNGAPPSGNAPPPTACLDRDQMVRSLAERFGEVPVAVGEAEDGVIEVLANESGPTWTIIVTTRSGRSCIVAAGGRWRNMLQVASPGMPI